MRAVESYVYSLIIAARLSYICFTLAFVCLHSLSTEQHKTTTTIQIYMSGVATWTQYTKGTFLCILNHFLCVCLLDFLFSLLRSFAHIVAAVALDSNVSVSLCLYRHVNVCWRAEPCMYVNLSLLYAQRELHTSFPFDRCARQDRFRLSSFFIYIHSFLCLSVFFFVTISCTL